MAGCQIMEAPKYTIIPALFNTESLLLITINYL